MSQKSKKKGGSPSNVLFLSRYRNPSASRSTAFYLNEEGCEQESLERDPALRLINIRSERDLKVQQTAHSPEIILIESSLTWADPLELIRNLDRVYKVPIIFICKGSNSSAKNRKKVKDAYAAGACDTLFTPMESEELFAALDVLLKFQERQSLYH